MHFVKHESSSAYVKKHMMQDNPNVEYNQSLYSTTSNRTKHTGPYLKAMMLSNVPIIMDIDTGSDVTVISSRQFEKNQCTIQCETEGLHGMACSEQMPSWI